MADPPIPSAALDSHIGLLGKTGSGKSNAAVVTVERLIRAKHRVCIIDPTDRYWGLRLMPDGKTPSGLEPVIFGGAHADLPLSAAHGAAVAEIAGTTTTPIILSTRLMTVGERTRFFTDFAETLLRKNDGPLHVVIDEAHLFMPQAGARVGGEAPKMLHAGNNLVSLGRGIGLRIMLLSQRPAKLHKDSLTQIETLIAFRLIAPQDRSAIREWVKEWADEQTGTAMMSSLPSLPTGSAWLWAPELNVLRQVDFPLASTFDSGKPQKPGSKSPDLKPIDLAAVRGKLETVAKEAIENDPRRLKARIAELEKQLTARQKPDPTILEQQWQDGYHQGRTEQAAESAERIAQMQRAITGALECLGNFVDRPKDGSTPVVNLRPVARPAIDAAPARPVMMPATSCPVVPPARQASDNGSLPKGERACLAAIAQHRDGVTREQLTVLTGYKRSSRDTYLQRLRERGFIAHLEGRLFSTPEGDAALGPDFDRLPIGDALREHWLGRLPEGERRILEAIIGYYPDAATKAEIDEATGYKRSSRDTYIQRLRARALVVTDAEGVRAADTLFGGGDA